MQKFAMKAAPRYPEQLKDRVKKFTELKLAPIIELHLFGLNDIFEDSQKIAGYCHDFPGVEYLVHFPLMDCSRGYIFDVFQEEEKNIRAALDFCVLISAKVLILHYCFGFDRSFTKNDAQKGLREKVAVWDSWAKENDIKILYENYGFVWLPEGFKKDFCVSPLDHFFPWDMLDFIGFLRKYKLDNTGLLLDLAHACISANMFNILKSNADFSSDRRFANIYPSDMAKCRKLKLEDYLVGDIDYYHISDSYTWEVDSGTTDLKKYLYSEGLPIGKGTIEYPSLLGRLSPDKTLIMEILPEDGAHADNRDQANAVKLFKDYYSKKRSRLCV